MAAGRSVVGRLVLAIAVLAAGPASAELKRPTLAIVGFRPIASGRTLPPPQLCEAATQIMLDRLVSSGEFHVYDGQWLARADAANGPVLDAALREAARTAGIEYLAYGAITRFTTEIRDRGLGGAAMRWPLLAGAHRRRNELTLSVSVRVVDVRTGEVVTTATGTGAGNRTAGRLGGLGLIGAGGFTRGSSNARDAQLDEALRQSVDLAVRELVAAAPRMSR